MMSTSLKGRCWGWTDGRWRGEGGVEGIKGVKGRSWGSIGALRALWGASYVVSMRDACLCPCAYRDIPSLSRFSLQRYEMISTIDPIGDWHRGILRQGNI